MNVQSSAYVSTASEWLPTPPSHWQVKPFRHCFRPSDERNGPTPIGEMLSVSGYRGVVVKNYEFEEQKRSAEELETYRVVRPGQLAVNTMWLNYTGLGVSEHLGYVSPAYRAYWVQPGLHGRYVHHLLRSSVYVAGYTSLLQGIRPNSLQVPTDSFHSIPILVPPLEEQQIIAGYLDRETGRIDALVERLERLIALLTEKRQAVISHAVIKGLNPDAPMKDSGIDWLGEVPAHWDVKPLRYAIWYQEGPGILADDFYEEGVPLIRVSGVRGRWASLDGCNYLDPEKVERRWKHFKVTLGDLLISASASMGVVTEVGPDVVGAVPYTGIIRMRPILGETTRDFIRSFFVSNQFMTQVDLLKAGATIQHFGPSHLSQMQMAVPPIEEQERITSFVDAAINEYMETEAKAQSVLDAVKERRSAMISAAVTGQIPLADMTEEDPA
ncbi:type I restriction enzyme S subunit [Litoreibacter meonggei]|uniref:Type I restriction enzyme S subunit n=1 Tax=Litoreibacter meonggei TaxID=1049199 RepID=A0A497WR54_9RHOB|nr:restriction endonuclease subunit S [Litoreibacter meonggei]RLJ59110.1 type I restriction enzyme S subunit [Litoreibacter meonggei]